MNLYRMASRGVDLDALPDEEPPARAMLDLGAPAPGQRFSVPEALNGAFDAAAQEYGVDADVLRAMAFAESRFRPDVISGQVKSRTGAAGLMQFMPATAERFGINPTDPIESIFGAAAYMRSNLDKFGGDYGKAVAAYNWGENRRAFDSEDWQGQAPAETRGYLKTVFAMADDLKLRAPPPAPAAEPSPAPAASPVAAAPARREVPGMSVGSVAQDIVSGALQIGPTAVKGVADLARLATGDYLGKDLSDSMEEGIKSIQGSVGSERAAAQRENFQRDMADPNVSIGQALANNKGALADQVLPTLGSMLLPVGAAGLAGKAATIGKTAAGLETAALASRVASAQQMAGIGATAAQNAADVFAGLVDKGYSLEDAYRAAGITVPFSVIAGKLTGGGAEVALARQAAGQAVRGGAVGVAKGAAREGVQEVGEELGQVTGEAVGTGITPDATNTGKRLAVAGTLGAVVGGGVDVAGHIGGKPEPSQAPRVEDQPTVPVAPEVPAAPLEQVAATSQEAAASTPPVDGTAWSEVAAADKRARAEAEVARKLAEVDGTAAAQAATVPSNPAPQSVPASDLTAAPGDIARQVLASDAATPGAQVAPVVAPPAMPQAVQQPTPAPVQIQPAPAQSQPVVAETSNVPQGTTQATTQQPAKAPSAPAANLGRVDAAVPAGPVPPTGTAAAQAPGVAPAQTTTAPAPVGQYSKEMTPELAAAIMAVKPPARATVESVDAALNELVPTDRALPRGLGKVVVATAKDIKSHWQPLIGKVDMNSEDAGRAQGFYDPRTKTVFIVADNIKPGEEKGVIAHELMHKHGQAVLGREGWKQLHSNVGTWATAQEGSQERQVHDEAAARVRESRPDGADEGGYSEQELFPYAVQVATEMGIKPSIGAPLGSVSRWLYQVRTALGQAWTRITGRPETFKTQDLVNLAFGIAQRENPAHRGELDNATQEQGAQRVEQAETPPPQDESADMAYSREGPEGTGLVNEVRAAIAAGLKNDEAALRVQVPLGIETPAVLQMLGVPRKPVVTNRDLIAKMHIEHGVPRADLNRLGELLANPVLVFKSDTQPGRFTVVTSLVVNGKPVVVAVEPNGKMGRAEVVYVPTAYPKDNADAAISGWLSKGLLLYAHKDESRRLATTARLQLPGVVRRAVGFRPNYKTESDLPQNGADGPMFSRAKPDEAAPPPAEPAAAPAAPERELTPVPQETRARRFQRAMQDKLNRVTVLRNWAKENDIELSSESDVWGYEARMHGSVATRVEDFREQTVKPLIERIQKAGYSMEQVAEYLHAKHAQERNAQIESLDPSIKDGSGMTNAEAQAILAKAPEGLAPLAAEVQAITGSTRQILLDAGIISDEMASAWDAAYQNYVPLKGGDEAKQGGTGKGLSVDGRQKRALGHGSRDEKIVENILRDHERAIMLAEKNKVGQSLLVLVDELNNPDIATIGQPEKRRVLKQGSMFEARTADGIVVESFATQQQALNFVAAHPDMKLSVKKVTADPMVVSMASPMLGPNEVQVYLKGHAVRVQLNDELLARAYQNLGPENFTAMMKINREVNAMLSRVYTALNPEFFAKNVLRDFTAGLTITTAKYGAGVAARAVKNYPKAMAQLLRYGFTKEASPSMVSYRLAGGSTGAAYLGDLQRIGEDVQATFDDARGVAATTKSDGAWRGAKSVGRKALRAGTKYFEILNAAGESAMRLSVFEAMRETGHDVRESASAAKELMNFNRQGEATRTVGGWYLFLNASIQGTAAIADALVHGKNREQGWAMVAGMAGLFYALAQGQFGDDDEGKKAWERISQDVKSKNLIIRTGTDSYLTIPVPYGLGAFFGIGNAAYDLQRGEDPEKVALHLALNFADHFLPVKPYAEGGDTRGLVELVPGVAGGELMRAALRAGVNRSGLGGDIVPDSKFDEGKPDNLRAYRNTRTSVFQTIATQLNAATGGTPTQAGLIDVSPESLKYWTRTFTGGAGLFLADTVGMLKLGKEALLNPDDPDLSALMPEISEVPVVRGFSREDRVTDDRRQYWQAAKEVMSAQQDMQRAKKIGDEEGMQRVEDRRGELLYLVKTMERNSKWIREIRDEIEETMLDETTSLAFKRAAVKRLEAEESGIYREFIDVYVEDRAEAKKERASEGK